MIRSCDQGGNQSSELRLPSPQSYCSLSCAVLTGSRLVVSNQRDEEIEKIEMIGKVRGEKIEMRGKVRGYKDFIII